MKYEDEDIFVDYELTEPEKKVEKSFNVFIRLAAGFSVSTIMFTIGTTLGLPFSIPVAGACLLVGMPTTYIGLTKLKEKINENYVRDMHMFEQFTRGMEEFREDETVNHKQVTEGMAVFYSFISNKDTQDKIPQSEYNAINSFLFMINENYYEKISSNSYNKLSRTTLIEMMIQIILNELRENERFDDIVAEDVINRAFFIPEDIKKEMIKEFRKSKSKLIGSEPMYKIISSRVSMKEIQEKINDNKDALPSKDNSKFDIRNPKHYKLMLDDFNEHELNDYGDFNSLDWDFKLFRDIIVMIDDLYSYQLEGLYENYDINLLAATLLHNVGVYCLLNKREHVGMQEILNAMREWGYLDYDDKLIIIESIYQEFSGMEHITHPFTNGEYRPKVTKNIEQEGDCKIIKFPGPKM